MRSSRGKPLGAPEPGRFLSGESGFGEAPAPCNRPVGHHTRQPQGSITPATRNGKTVRVARGDAVAGLSLPASARGLRPCVSGPAYQARDHRDDEEDDRHPEQHLRAAHGGSRDTAEAEEGRDERHHEEDDSPVQKGTHDLLLMFW